MRLAGFLLSLFFFTKGSVSLAADSEKLLYRDSLNSLIGVVLSRASEEKRIEANQSILRIFNKILILPGYYDFPFDSMPAFAVFSPADKSFRIINWELPFPPSRWEYYGFIQHKPNQDNYPSAFRLSDYRSGIKNLAGFRGDATKWPGAHYYQLIECGRSGKNKYYLLLGIDWNNAVSRKKLIEVLSFQADGAPVFGKQVFVQKGVQPHRIVFEYSSEVSMSLKYEQSRDRIVFDHLAAPEGMRNAPAGTMAPDLSYDAYKRKKGKWRLMENIDARNEK